MIYFDIVYSLIVLWTGLIVAKNIDNHEGSGAIISQILSAFLIVGSIKNIIFLFL